MRGLYAELAYGWLFCNSDCTCCWIALSVFHSLRTYCTRSLDPMGSSNWQTSVSPRKSTPSKPYKPRVTRLTMWVSTRPKIQRDPQDSTRIVSPVMLARRCSSVRVPRMRQLRKKNNFFFFFFKFCFSSGGVRSWEIRQILWYVVSGCHHVHIVSESSSFSAVASAVGLRWENMTWGCFLKKHNGGGKWTEKYDSIELSNWRQLSRLTKLAEFQFSNLAHRVSLGRTELDSIVDCCVLQTLRVPAVLQ